jgi:hypothetical protein
MIGKFPGKGVRCKIIIEDKRESQIKWSKKNIECLLTYFHKSIKNEVS